MEIATLIWILVSVFAIAGIAGFMRAKREKVLGIGKNWFGFVAMFVAVFLVLGQLGYLANYGVSFSASDTGVPEPSGDNKPVDTKLCAVEDTTVTLSAVDKYSSIATGGSHRYSVNGAPSIVIADAGTFTASPGDKINILWNNGTTSGAFSILDSVTVPCVGTKTFPTKTVNNGTITASVFNNLDQLTGSGVNVTLGAGDIKNAKLKIQGQYQKEVPYGMIAVVEFNKTSMDSIVLTSGGVELASASVPHSFSATFATESVTRAYKMPAIVSNSEYNYGITLDASDTVNPSVTNAGSDVKITLYPDNYFVNEKNGGAFEGPSAEDEANAITHLTLPTITIPVD